MKRMPDLDELLTRLAAGQIVPLPAAHWQALSPGFQVERLIETGLAGSILLVRWPVPGARRRGWALIEQPRPEERVVRPLPDRRSALALIADRLAAYERMWDG